MLTDHQATTLLELFEADQVILDATRLVTYEVDAGWDEGCPDAVVLPHDTDDVQRLARWAHNHGVPLVAWGSGTGYTGGAVATDGGVVVSFARMNRVLHTDGKSLQALVQPGIIADRLNQHLGGLGLAFPPDPASRSACTVGGEIAENAGGPRCLKYGVTTNYVLGLEVVLADGQLISLGASALDPPGYDLTSLVVGSEGTLALITRALLRLRRMPAGLSTLTAVFDSVTTAGKAVSAITAAGLIPATVELMDSNLLQIVETYLDINVPERARAMLIMDVDGYPASLSDQIKEIVAVLNRFDPLELDVATTEAGREQLWLARRSAGPAHARISPSEHGIDVSVPRSRLAEAIGAIRDISDSQELLVTFMGHAGDGNLHPTWLCDLSDPTDVQRIREAERGVLAAVTELGGSIGAEHGIGIEKRDYLPLMYTPDEIGAMLEVQEAFDPQGLLNPGKIFPSGSSPAQAQAGISLDLPGPGRFQPTCTEEAREALQILQAAGRPAFVTGGSTKWRGEPDDGDGSILSTLGLDSVIRVSTDDLYVTGQAGTRIASLQAALAERNFWIPWSNPWPGATLGGIVAANLNGPLRCLYGPVRDYVLAAEVVLPMGRAHQWGRPLVKDVAGYQMAKLFVGSHGTLGLLTELSLRIVPLPLTTRRFAASVPDLPRGIDLASAVLGVSKFCSGTVLASGRADDTPSGGWRLLLRFDGHPADVEAESILVRGVLESAGGFELAEVDDGDGPAATWEERLRLAHAAARAAVPASKLGDFIAEMGGPITDQCLVDVANGIVTFATPDTDGERFAASLSQLRRGAQPLGGYAALAAAPRNWFRTMEAWGSPPDSLAIMTRIRERWDPAGVVNPGEFVVS